MDYDLSFLEPLIKYIPKKVIVETNDYLVMGRIDKNITDFFCITFAYSLFLSMFGFWLFLFFFGLPLAFVFGVLSFFSTFYFSIYYAKMKAIRISQEAERDLPMALRALAVELNIDIPFEQALTNLAKGGYGRASEIFSSILKDVFSGSSVPKAIQRISGKYYSQNVKRMLAHLASAYKVGKSKNIRPGDILMKLASEQLAIQKSEAKAFSGKLTLYSLAFITFSAILPGLFQIMITVGSLVLSMSLTPFDVILISGVVFPVIDLVMILMIQFKTPIFMRS